jgi:hypothetical protein
MRACRRRARRRLQRQQWHGCCCRYGVGSGGRRVHVGSVRGACAPAASVVPNHWTFAARTAGDGAGVGRVGAGALTTNGAVKITSAAPDTARTLAGSGLADRSDDSPARAPNHAAGGGGSRAGGRGLGGPHASGASATHGEGAAAPCAWAGARGSGDRCICGLPSRLAAAAEHRSMPIFSTSCAIVVTRLRALARLAPRSRARSAP